MSAKLKTKDPVGIIPHLASQNCEDQVIMTVGSPVSSRSLLFRLLPVHRAKICRSGWLLACTHNRDGMLGGRLPCIYHFYMYTECGLLSEASVASEEVDDKDVVSSNSLINTFSQMGPSGSDVVLDLFRQMRNHGSNVLANCFIFTGVFTTAASHPSWCIGDACGRQAHCVAINSLLNMYYKLGYLSDACKLFDYIPMRNSISWASR